MKPNLRGALRQGTGMTAPEELAHLLKAVDKATKHRAEAAIAVAHAASNGADLGEVLAAFRSAEVVLAAAERAWRAR